MRGAGTLPVLGAAPGTVPVALALLGAALAGCAGSRGLTQPSVLLDRVQAAETARAADDEAIARALRSDAPLLQSAALRALGRIESPASAPLAIPLAQSRDETVATWAAFALGQIGGEAAEGALLAAVAHGTAPHEALRALGRGGEARVAPAVVAYLDDARPRVRAAAAIALGLLAKRHGKAVHTDPAAIARLGAAARDAERDVRFAATYALMRLARPEASLALIPALADADPEIRAQAARGLGLAGASPAVLDPLLDDPDARVRVEVVRAIALVGTATKAASSAAAARLATWVEREKARWADPTRTAGASHVLSELVTGALGLGEAGDRALTALAELAEAPPPVEAIERARLACAVAFALDARAGEHARVKTCGDTSLPAWRRLELEARLLARAGELEPLAALTAHADERVRAAAVDALSSIDTDAARQVLVSLFEAADLYVASGAASALGEALGKGYRPADLQAHLGALLERTAADPDPGFVTGVIDAVAALGPDGLGLVAQLDALAADPRPAVRRRAAAAKSAVEGAPPSVPGAAPDEDRTALPEGRVRARLQTTRGDVEVLLFADVAPRTVARFVALARSGFYAGRTFHRVVPDFVVQTGCPRGDGWGGPGEALLDETSPLPFVRGALGIATSGRDTGGSQFFVMHTNHPHLDGEYTLFGQVTAGMEVVDLLVQDDRLLGVTVLGD